MGHLYLLAGSNGAGKTTFYEKVLGPATGLPFVNADVIAEALAGGAEITHEISAKAAISAAERREEMLARSASFIAETVFSHPSKVDLVRAAMAAGYEVHLHIIVVPEDLAVARVNARVANGGHGVPEDKIRSRYERLWGLVVEAIAAASEAIVYDNSSLDYPFRVMAHFEGGVLLERPVVPWPSWAPAPLSEATGNA